MREQFKEYYAPDEGEIKRLWTEAWFVFDTNALLGFYRTSAKVVDEAFSLISDLHDRLWLPHQVALEYHENYPGVEAAILSAPRDSGELLEGAVAKLQQGLAEKRHPYLQASLFAEIEKFKKATKRLIERKEIHDADFVRRRIHHVQDFIDREFVTVGAPYDDKRLQEIYADGEMRFKRNVPPAFKDKGKDKDETGNRKYGDLVLWKQILDHAQQTKRPVIFITNDSKEDWWQKQSGRIIGPHPLLRREMKTITGQDYYSYTIERFVEYGVPQVQKRKVKHEAEVDAKVTERTENAISRTMRDDSMWSEILANRIMNYPSSLTSVLLSDPELIAKLNLTLPPDLQAAFRNVLGIPSKGMQESFRRALGKEAHITNALRHLVEVDEAERRIANRVQHQIELAENANNNAEDDSKQGS